MFGRGFGVFYEEGGFGMIPTTVFGFCLLAWVVLYALRADNKLRPTLTTLHLLVLGSGILGTTAGLIATFHAGHEVAREDLLLLLVTGTAESIHNLAFAFIFNLLALLISVVGTVRESRRPGVAQ